MSNLLLSLRLYLLLLLMNSGLIFFCPTNIFTDLQAVDFYVPTTVSNIAYHLHTGHVQDISELLESYHIGSMACFSKDRSSQLLLSGVFRFIIFPFLSETIVSCDF